MKLRLNFFDAIGRDFHQSHFYAVANYGSEYPSHKRSCREVPWLVNNEAWDVVEIRVGRGDLLDAEAAGDGEVERVEGEQAVLSLEFEREIVVFDFHGFHLQTAAEKVAGFTGVLRELLDESLVLAEGAGGVRAC